MHEKVAFFFVEKIQTANQTCIFSCFYQLTWTSLTSKPEVWSREEKAEKKVLEWWAGGVAVSSIGTIGMIGNIVSLIAISLLPSHRKTMFYKLLLTLAIFDIMFISSGGLFMVQQAFRFRFEFFDICFPKIIYPAAGFGMTGK